MFPSVSVLVVTYAHADYVEKAVRSALVQSVAPLEIVVVDDGSGDGTADVAEAIADPRVRVLREAHRGIERLAETYNVGLSVCSGEVVAILEGDDEWPLRKLEMQLPAFERPEVVVCHGTYAVVGARGSVLRDRVPPLPPLSAGPYDALPLHLAMSYVMPVTALVRRSALLSIGGFRPLGPTVHWDYPTFLALAEQGRFFYVPEVVGLWRKHARSGTMALTGRDIEGVDRSLELALRTRARLSERAGLPTEAAVRAQWQEAFARQIWHVGRLLLVERRFREAKSLVLRALLRGGSLRTRSMLLLVAVAALARIDIEALLRLLRRRSTIEELS